QPAWLGWAATAATGLALALNARDRRPNLARPALYALGLVCVGLLVLELRPSPVQLRAEAPLLLAGLAMIAGGIVWLATQQGDETTTIDDRKWIWFPFAQGIVGLAALWLGILATVEQPQLVGRLAGPASAVLLAVAAWLLGAVSPALAAEKPK